MKKENKSKFMRFITLPIRALTKAKDIYVKSITGCASNMSYNQNTVFSPMPRSYSTSSAASSAAVGSNGEDYKELIRAASVRNSGHKNEVEMLLEQKKKEIVRRSNSNTNSSSTNRLPKSCSVGMGKIDEEIVSEFGGEEDGGSVSNLRELNSIKNTNTNVKYPRSKSYAVARSQVL